MKLIINKEYFELVPRPSHEDYEDLKDSISKNGQLVPIIVNVKNVIIDGYTRNQICKELSITPKVTVKKFKNKTEELQYVISLNFERRQLTIFQKVEAILPFYEKFREEARVKYHMQPEGKQGNHKGKSTKSLIVDIISKHIDNDNSQVKKCLDILLSKDVNIITQVKTGTITPNIGYELFKQNKAIKKRLKSGNFEPVSDIDEEYHPTAYEGMGNENNYVRFDDAPQKEFIEVIKDVNIECTTCDGTGKILLTELVKKLKFTPGWYIAGVEHHYFIAKNTPICFKITSAHTPVNEDDVKFRCVKCNKFYNSVIKKNPEVISQ